MISDKVYRYLETKIDGLKKEERMEKDSERFKTLDEVFDHQTLLTLYKLMTTKKLEEIQFPISTGKEANVFFGVDPDGRPVAIKIYRISTATFRTFSRYIAGDPRFRYQGRDHRRLVYTWAQKEFKNLMRMESHDIRVPHPITHRNNILLMDYIGDETGPAPVLKDVGLPADAAPAAFEQIIDWIRTMYCDGRFVHGDISEYNLLVHDAALVLIDVAQGVLLDHPMAEELLERDVRNICAYFKRLGVERAKDRDAIVASIRAAAVASTGNDG